MIPTNYSDISILFVGNNGFYGPLPSGFGMKNFSCNLGKRTGLCILNDSAYCTDAQDCVVSGIPDPLSKDCELVLQWLVYQGNDTLIEVFASQCIQLKITHLFVDPLIQVSF